MIKDFIRRYNRKFLCKVHCWNIRRLGYRHDYLNYNLDLYYDSNRKRPKNFSELIKGLNSKKSDFGPSKRTVSRLVNKIERFRIESNYATHTITIIPNVHEVEEYEIQEIIDFICEVMK